MLVAQYRRLSEFSLLTPELELHSPCQKAGKGLQGRASRTLVACKRRIGRELISTGERVSGDGLKGLQMSYTAQFNANGLGLKEWFYREQLCFRVCKRRKEQS